MIAANTREVPGGLGAETKVEARSDSEPRKGLTPIGGTPKKEIE